MNAILQFIVAALTIGGAALLAGDIHDAAEQGDVDKLKILLAKDPNLVSAKDKAGNQPLHAAAMKGNISSMKALLDAKAEVNAKGFDDWTPLHYAAKSGSAEACTLLLERGASRDALNGVKRTPLQMATGSAMRAIRDFAPKVEGAEKVFDSIATGDLDKLKQLIATNHALLEAKDSQGRTPLLVAATRATETEMLQMLLEAGSNVQATARSGASALATALDACNADAVEILLQHHARPTHDGEFDELLRVACVEISEAATPDLLKIAQEISSVPRMMSEWSSRAALFARIHEILAMHPLGEKHVQSKRRIARMMLDHGADPAAQNETGLVAIEAAAMSPTHHALQLLLERGASPVQARGRGVLALTLAVMMGCRESVRLLLSSGVDPIGADENPRAFGMACMGGDAEIVRMMLATIKDKSHLKSLVNPLINAAREGHLKIVNLLLEMGVDAKGTTSLKMTALHGAAQGSSTEMTLALIKAGADVNARDVAGYTPLNNAAEANQPAQIALLLEHGATIGNANASGVNPLLTAASQGHPDCVAALLKAGADPKATDNRGYCALHAAAGNGHEAVVRLLLDAGMPVDFPARDSTETALCWVARGRQGQAKSLTEGSREIGGMTMLAGRENTDAAFVNTARLLLSRGANVNVAARDGSTPLQIAAGMGAIGIVSLLLDHGADVEAVQRNHPAKFTPLLSAIQYGQAEVIELLIQRGANLQVKAFDTGSVMHIAAMSDKPEGAEVLLKHGIKVDVRDKTQQTPLMVAAGGGSMHMVQWLLEHHAEPNAQAAFGMTAMQYAARANHQEIVRYLGANGAKH